MTHSVKSSFRHFQAWVADPAKSWRMPAFLFCLLFITGFLGAAQTGLFDRDEPRYAQATREMVKSGNWVVPSFNGEPRLHKPILIYWLMSASFALFGDSATAARMPSVIAGACAGTLLYLWALRWFGRRSALLSVMVWATVPLTLVESRMATTDAVLNLLSIGMLCCLSGLYAGPRPWVARLFWLLLGLSILTKGPVGLLVVVSALVGSRILSGVSFPMKHLRIWDGLLIVSLTVVPWLVAVTLQTGGDFLQFAVGRELLGRLVSPAEEHRGFPGYYILLLVPMFFPWICFLPGSLKHAWSERKLDSRFGFLLGWAFGPLFVLELLATKLVHYHYSSYAALAVITGVQLSHLEAIRLRPNLLAGGKFLRSALAVTFSLVTILFFALAWVGTWQMALPGVLIAIMTGYYLFRMLPDAAQGHWREVIQRTGVAWACCVLVILGWLLPASESNRLNQRVATTLNKYSQKMQVPVILGEFREPSIIFQIDAPEDVAITRSIPQIRTIITNRGAAIMPMTEAEWKKSLQVEELDVQQLDKIEALDWNRGERREIRFCLVTLKPEYRLAQIPGSKRGPEPQSSDARVVK